MEKQPNTLYDIVEVKTLHYDYEVNEHLSQGWILLETCKYYRDDIQSHEMRWQMGRQSSVKPYIDPSLPLLNDVTYD